MKITYNEKHNDVVDSFIYSMNFIPGATTTIYVKWRWLDRLLVRILKPFKKL